MKSIQKPTSVRSYKRKKKAQITEIKTLCLLLGLLAVLLIAENFFTILAFVLPVRVEKVFAKEIQDMESLLSPTVTPESGPLFSITTLIEATPTPTQTPATVLKPSEKDFCLNVPILIYHHVQPLAEAQALGHAQLTVDSNIFDEQMNYLVSHGYTTISSDQVVNALLTHQQLPPKSIVVTLDDGYDDFYNYALPIAKKHNVTLDWMIPSGLINNPGYMTWDQLKEASQNSLIHIYNHTWSHAALGDASHEKIEQEVMTANNQLEANLGGKVTLFVYPYGSFGPGVIGFLKDHGFVGGISTINGTMQCESYVMTLHRTHIGNAPLNSYGF